MPHKEIPPIIDIPKPDITLPTREDLETLSAEELHNMWRENNAQFMTVLEAAGDDLRGIPYFGLQGMKEEQLEKFMKDRSEFLGNIATFYQKDSVQNKELFLQFLLTMCLYTSFMAGFRNPEEEGGVLITDLYNYNEGEKCADNPILIGGFPSWHSLDSANEQELLDLTRTSNAVVQSEQHFPQRDSLSISDGNKFDKHIKGVFIAGDAERYFSLPIRGAVDGEIVDDLACRDNVRINSLAARLLCQEILHKALGLLRVYPMEQSEREKLEALLVAGREKLQKL